MNIILKSKNLEITSSIENYLNKKLVTLEKFLKDFNLELIKVEIQIERTTRHHKEGDIYRAEINLSINGKLLRVESEQETLFAAIDEVRDDLEEEIKKFKSKKETVFLRGARSIRKRITLSPLARFKRRK